MKLNKTKIVATIGPSSSSRPMLKRLIVAGVDVFRINFSHSSYKETAETVREIRSLNEELNKHASVLGDLQGPKIRVGLVKEGVCLKKGNHISFTTKEIKEAGNDELVSINYKNFPLDVDINERILINDGKLILKVIETNKKDLVKTRIVQGGALESNKGVNLPNTEISLPALTSKDIADATFAIKNNFDWIALSFVRSKKDISSLKKLIEVFEEDSQKEIEVLQKSLGILNKGGDLKELELSSPVLSVV